MNKFFRVSMFALALSSMAFLASCDEDPPLPNNDVVFQTSSAGLAEAATEVTVNLTLVRAAEADGSIVIAFTGTGVAYGDDFTTEPAAVDGKVTVPVTAGATTASFKVLKTNTTGLEGTEKVDFTIESASEGLVVGEAKTFSLTFSEIIATEASMQVNGGGTNGQNRVFIDLSANSQVAVARSVWDLAFASAADQFRVVLNSSNKMLVYKLDKTDLTEVTEDDTVGLGAKVSLESIFAVVNSPDPLPDWIPGALAWMDDRSGDLSKTAIAEISDEDDHNHVYIINRGTNANNEFIGWLKVRILRDGDGYAIQYAEINSGTFATEVVNKDATHNFTYFSFDTDGEVDVEPAKGDWDIAWTAFTNITPASFTDPTAPFVPYFNQDIILTNIHGGAKAFQYVTGDPTTPPSPGQPANTGTKTYDTFMEADLGVITNYGTSQLTIGSGWRALGQAGASVNANRFYIIEDPDGNIYKLQFTTLTTNDERGKPQLRFELLKKAS